MKSFVAQVFSMVGADEKFANINTETFTRLYFIFIPSTALAVALN